MTTATELERLLARRSDSESYPLLLAVAARAQELGIPSARARDVVLRHAPAPAADLARDVITWRSVWRRAERFRTQPHDPAHQLRLGLAHALSQPAHLVGAIAVIALAAAAAAETRGQIVLPAGRLAVAIGGSDDSANRRLRALAEAGVLRAHRRSGSPRVVALRRAPRQAWLAVREMPAETIEELFTRMTDPVVSYGGAIKAQDVLFAWAAEHGLDTAMTAEQRRLSRARLRNASDLEGLRPAAIAAKREAEAAYNLQVEQRVASLREARERSARAWNGVRQLLKTIGRPPAGMGADVKVWAGKARQLLSTVPTELIPHVHRALVTVLSDNGRSEAEARTVANAIMERTAE